MTLLQDFQLQVESLGLSRGRAIVAVSGGPDSVALLDLLVRSEAGPFSGLVVAHVDHGIRPDSGRQAEVVRDLAGSYGLPFVAGRLELGPDAGETRAREERYAWLEAARVGNEARYIVTAHHADDQAETVLMRVLEGSGPAGLAAMAPVSGALVRPLLPFRRAQLAAYLEERGLTGWIDPANSDPRHLRSWTRTQLLPLVRSRLPDVDRRLLRVADQARKDRAAWDAVLDLLPGLDLQVEAEGISVAAPALAGYDSELAQAVLLAAARRVGCRLVPSRIGRVLDLLEGGASGSRVPLGGRWMAELAFGRLRIAPLDEATGLHPWTLEGQSGEGVWGRWRFRWEPATAPARQGRAGLSAWFTPDPLVVRAWSAGEKLRPLGGAGHRLVVRCFQELRVPRGRRSSWPVLAENDEVLWIPGVCRSDARLPAGGTEALRVDAEFA